MQPGEHKNYCQVNEDSDQKPLTFLSQQMQLGESNTAILLIKYNREIAKIIVTVIRMQPLLYLTIQPPNISVINNTDRRREISLSFTMQPGKRKHYSY